MNTTRNEAVRPRTTLENTVRSAETSRSPKVSIANLHRKFYPLNYSLYSSLKPTVKKFKKRKPLEDYPEFLEEFIDEKTKDKFVAAPKVKTRCSFHKNFNRTTDVDRECMRGIPITESPHIPTIRYREVLSRGSRKYDGSIKDERIYRPNTISVSKRAKITLYTQSPFCFQETSNIKKDKQHMRKSVFLRLISKKTKENKASLNTFNDHLKILNDSIKDPLFYEI